jgi:hypothetical protein
MIQTSMTPYELAWQAIGLFLEYRDQLGCSEQDAQHRAATEIQQGINRERP